MYSVYVYAYSQLMQFSIIIHAQWFHYTKRKVLCVNRKQRAGRVKRAILATVLEVLLISQRFTVYALSHIARSNKTAVHVAY